MKITVTDISDSDLETQIAIMNVDNPIRITKTKVNGLWTIVGEFPDNEVTSETTKSTSPASSNNQSNVDASDSAIDTLARTLWGEARGETKAGREAIASVILNRLKKNKPSRFGGTIEEVCQKPSQFSCWNADDPNLPKLKKVDTSNPVFAECVAIAENAVQGLLADSVIGADHYHTAGVSPAWSRGKVPCITIGNHLFFNNIA